MVEDVSVHGYVSRKGYEGLEAGTPNIAGGIALGSAADYLQRVGLEEIREHEATLSSRLWQGLKEIDGVEVYGELIVERLGDKALFASPHLRCLRGTTVAKLGLQRLAHSGGDDIASLAPIYVRPSDAEITWAKAHGSE